MNTSTVFHLLPSESYHSAPGEPITAASLEREGFVHCSPDAETALAVANSLYRSTEEQLVLLELDAASLSAPVRWEAPAPVPPEGVPAGTLFPHVYGALDRAAIRGVSYARRDAEDRFVSFESRGEIAERLDLLPHPEGGWYRRTWTCAQTSRPEGRGVRPSATAIYYLLPAGQRSRWHRVESDELWMWHRGPALLLRGAGRGREPEERTEAVKLGPGLADGQVPQSLVPADSWQCAENTGDTDTLVSCVVSPGFDFADFQMI
ncbi:hypothetical protein SAMN04487905_105176 [Actinopolyspora xinjiangensis]|uniref:DUF985 domain-containing protein n=1 Tax=Actinopolyspora xinjiangensis TaxID=405564 RepID=A0A1H0TN78_9ACTN|nr:cupin domain-containing protein [Actinopolyspora xinjiangensis]SDP55459.1 hypothetical protein SAMN04487905_105176 [Actinopolyspora xinjiangensis]